MNEKKHNGWSNYETWAVKLWIDNEQASQEYWRDRAREAKEVGKAKDRPDYFTAKEHATFWLADALKDIHEGSKPDVEGVYSDLLNASLSEVNWHEIAKSLIEGLDE